MSNPQRSFGDMPLIVLSAGQDGSTPDLPAAIRAELPTQMREKQQIYRQLATLSTRGVHRVVPDSTHDIPHIRPQAVVAAIDEVVDDVRNQRGAAVERER